MNYRTAIILFFAACLPTSLTLGKPPDQLFYIVEATNANAGNAFQDVALLGRAGFGQHVLFFVVSSLPGRLFQKGLKPDMRIVESDSLDKQWDPSNALFSDIILTTTAFEKYSEKQLPSGSHILSLNGGRKALVLLTGAATNDLLDGAEEQAALIR